MTQLAELLRQRVASPTEEQERVNRAFEHAVRAGPLGLRTPHGPVPQSGLLVVVGLIPAWNSYDRDLVLALERGAVHLRRDAFQCKDKVAVVRVPRGDEADNDKEA